MVPEWNPKFENFSVSIVQFSDFSMISTVAVALAFTVALVAVLFLLAVAVNDSWGQFYKTFLSVIYKIL